MNKDTLENQSKNQCNPFIPTKRDIARTEELSSKNAVIAGFLTFIFLPGGLLYLNRGINSLKILGYVFAVSLMFNLVTKGEENSKSFSNLLGLIGTGAITAEQVMAVNKAQQRLQKQSSSVLAYSFEKNEKQFSDSETKQEAINQLKQLKEKYEANEISEEEFKLQKQIILSSL